MIQGRCLWFTRQDRLRLRPSPRPILFYECTAFWTISSKERNSSFSYDSIAAVTKNH